jgi:hypothetical protein
MGCVVAFVNLRLAAKQALSPGCRGYGKTLGARPLGRDTLLPVRNQ